MCNIPNRAAYSRTKMFHHLPYKVVGYLIIDSTKRRYAIWKITKITNDALSTSELT